LVASHIKQPHVSVRRSQLICQWLTSLRIQTEPITIQSYHKDFCTGVLLANLFKSLIPESTFPLLNARPLARGAAIKNLELSLAIIWRSKSVNNTRIANSNEIFEGNKLKIMVMLNELFETYVRPSVYSSSVKMLKWFHSILKQYGITIPVGVFTEQDFSSVWNTFQSGTALFCVIYHLSGPTMIGEGAETIRIDPMRVVNKPKNVIEFKSNVNYVFGLVRALKVDLIFTPNDWISFPDVDFVMVQLLLIWNVIKNKQCVLPPAMLNNAGVTSGSNGEPQVVGVVFSDSITLSIPVLTAAGTVTSSKRYVGMVGSAENSVALLPIDSSGRVGRFSSTVVPFGLLSTNMKIVHAPISIKGARTGMDKKIWISSVENNKEQDRAVGSRHVEKLKQKNKTTTSSIDDSKCRRFGGGVYEEKDIVPMELMMHEYTKEGYKQSVIKVNPDGSVPITSHPSVTIESVTAARERVETDMAESEAVLEASEDELSGRYLELEAKAHTLGIREYESKLSELERLRKSLEEERKKLNESFNLRMSSIDSQHIEAVVRAEAAPPPPSLKAPQAAKPKSAPSVKSDASYSIRQKGWISSTTENSHNFILNKIAETSKKETQVINDLNLDLN
jgi:Calponin homology (CH) domain